VPGSPDPAGPLRIQTLVKCAPPAADERAGLNGRLGAFVTSRGGIDVAGLLSPSSSCSAGSFWPRPDRCAPLILTRSRSFSSSAGPSWSGQARQWRPGACA